jgi:L-threonylcarbamoyladenylate synthase
MVMKLVKVNGNPGSAAELDELVKILENEGVICFPAESNYRLGASALSVKAVNSLVAAKRRSAHAPALVFVSKPEMLEEIAEDVSTVGKALARTFWPGPLTLLVTPGEVFPSKIRKTLTKATGLIGVRIPGHPVARGIVERFGRPVLVSSANLAKKTGATSPAQVRKNFGRHVEAMVDLGDLPPSPPSTLVDIAGDRIEIRRQGAVSEDEIRRIAASA